MGTTSGKDKGYNKKHLNALLDTLRHVELHLHMMDDVDNFSSALDENVQSNEDCSYLSKFQEEYADYSKTILESRGFLLCKKKELENLIKATCKHNYIEDEVDSYSGENEVTKKITYCDRCGMTF